MTDANNIKMELRETKKEEVLELVEISTASFNTDITISSGELVGPPMYDSFSWHLEMMNNHHLFVALVDNKLVGGAILFLDEKNLTNLYVGRIFIAPKYFHKGYGSMLMNKIESIYQGVTKIFLETPIWNVRTNNFYKKIGYTEERQDKNFIYYIKNIKKAA